jgi:ribosomal protein S18 acetylase RimI-like enzyme
VEAARPAIEDDLPAIAALARTAIAELRATKGGDLWFRTAARAEPMEESLAATLADPDQLLLAGTVDGVVVGYGAVRVERLRDGDLLAMMDDIYVDPEARGVAVGEVVMDAALEWAKERGCIGIDSLALPGNRDTKNFFERFGLVARAILVHRPL